MQLKPPKDGLFMARGPFGAQGFFSLAQWCRFSPQATKLAQMIDFDRPSVCM
jgi:hypothetical protein